MTEQLKHAYLILAHHNFGQLKKLLTLLDDERNDIYIHIDRKAHISEKELDDLSRAVTKANLEWTERIKVTWGGYSLVKAEYILLSAAVKKPHQYYHLISGADLPIKSQDEIHSFFSEHPENEFINFHRDVPTDYWIDTRIREYHFFQEIIGRRTESVPTFLLRLDEYSLSIQKKLGINRVKDNSKIYKGSQWFSITHDMALYILSRRREMKKLLRYGLAADELLVQTLVMASPFRQRVICNGKRAIDWKRGSPYIWRMEDFDYLMNSEALWARKFDEQVDNDIIEAIYEKLKN